MLKGVKRHEQECGKSFYHDLRFPGPAATFPCVHGFVAPCGTPSTHFPGPPVVDFVGDTCAIIPRNGGCVAAPVDRRLALGES